MRLRSAFIGAILGVLLVNSGIASADQLSFTPGSVSGVARNQDGTLDLVAGSHPWSYTVHFQFETDSEGATIGGRVRDLITELPAGLVGNPEAVPVCPRKLFDGGEPQCPASSQVGVLQAVVKPLGQVHGPVYNLEAPPGSAAQLGFDAQGFTSLQAASVKPGGGYPVEVGASNIPLEIFSATETIWGVPADPAHTPERTCRIEGAPPIEGCTSEAIPRAFLTLPRQCTNSPTLIVRADSALFPGAFVGEAAETLDESGFASTLSGCESVPFAPGVQAIPSTASADSSTGLDFKLSLPNEGLIAPGGIAEAQPVKTEVVLPLGVTINPSAANGIVGCTPAQFENANGEAGRGCPEASKVGTLVAKTPLLEEAIEGSVYVAQPHKNPFDSLLALYIVARAQGRGVLVKQAGVVHADQTTGQLTTTFDELPPLPYSSFEFNLREGSRAPLITPQACGAYDTLARLYSSAAPNAAIERTAVFHVTSGANAGRCASDEGGLPNVSMLEAGTLAPLAGSYAPFIFRVKREDGTQRFSSVSATLPSGLLGRIAGVPYCGELAIAAAASRIEEGGGTQELALPSCPAASQVGVVNVSAGAGPTPYSVQGKAYLAGPYKGAPLSLEIITPAIAGPFDLGSVAVRTALYVNESTAQIRAVSDALPSILHGIPLDVRTISLQMNKPEFVLNPTNCTEKSVTAGIESLAGTVASLSNPFVVGGCKALAFKPDLKLAFTGQTKRTGFPGIRAVLTQPAGQNANLSDATVILPKGMLIANAHINNPCTRVQYNSGRLPGEGCPAKSILGTAKVWTPLLEKPEEGKVYFRSNGGERELPDLAIALRGQVPLQLLGFVDSVGKKNAEVRRVRSRFLNLPDAPVSRFELKLSGGKKGLLQNSKNLCKVSDRATFSLTGQNGKSNDTEPKVQVSCGNRQKGKGKQK